MAISIYRQSIPIIPVLILLFAGSIYASSRGVTNTTSSPYVKLRSVDIDDVRWTEGFWAERFELCRTAMISSLTEVFGEVLMMKPVNVRFPKGATVRTPILA